MTTITIDPVTRIEGHGKVIITLHESGLVEGASFQTVEFRGFEKFCEGRMVWDMPTLTSRICGFCPVSHHLASVKACEAVFGVEPPPAASMLRELLLLGQFIQSHALHYFFCAMPDFLGVEPKDRNAFAMLNANSEAAQKAVKLRRVGQDIVDKVGGGRLHPVTCIPGGMSKTLDYLDRVELLKGVVQGLKIAKLAVENVKALYGANKETFDTFASFPSHYAGLSASGQLRLYDGTLRVVDHAGALVSEVAPRDYATLFDEQSAADSYTKTLFLKGRGEKDGVYRVGPLARLNVADSVSTPLAGAELAEFKQLGAGGPVAPSLFYHYARMIELLYAVERASELLRYGEILSAEVRIPVKRRAGEGVGVIEAPRGTLIHHYVAREDGRITKVNLVVATAHNKLAMNESVARVAQSLVSGGTIDEGQLNFVEMAIRCYDPCLSCSTHAFGKMPLEIELRDAAGTTRATFRRGGA
jgi:NAD-reducing hydrogenase large subunit